jgi:lipopolysaccharide/colanic/teichoic acid biosynthesis glycosyltransferase
MGLNGNGTAPRTRGGFARRAFDVVAAVVLIALTAPLLLIGVLTVLVGTGRPIFFGHVRLGLAGKAFRCWKLRTMSVDAEKVLEGEPALRSRHRANGFKLPNRADPRITKEGRWLRRTYVDELPQLFNVLFGSMSLLGPRPIVPDELEFFGDARHELLSVKPGVFGAWNSLGRERPTYPDRAEMEIEYVKRRNAVRDLRILGRSFLAVLQGQSDE